VGGEAGAVDALESYEDHELVAQLAIKEHRLRLFQIMRLIYARLRAYRVSETERADAMCESRVLKLEPTAATDFLKTLTR
jgi:hypothetical protein